MPRHLRLPAALLWPGLPLLYLLVPGHPLALLRGLPWDLVGLCAAVGLLILTVLLGARRQLAGWQTGALAGLCALKLGLALAAPPYGLEADYRTAQAPVPERSTEFPGAPFTRIDPALDFEGERFRVHFFNDVRRFNYYTPSQPRRDLLRFDVTWRGWLVPTGEAVRPRTLELWATGSARVELDGLAPLEVQRSAELTSRRLEVPAQAEPHRIEVRYSRPEGSVPILRLGWATPGGLEPLAAPELARAPLSADRVALDGVLAALARVIDALLLVAAVVFPLIPRDSVGASVVADIVVSIWSGVGAGLRPALRAARPAMFPRTGVRPHEGGSQTRPYVEPASLDAGAPAVPPSRGLAVSPSRRPAFSPSLLPCVDRAVIALVLLLGLLEALRTWGWLYGRTTILSGGNDWLAYEGYARDVLLNGPLASGGAAPGRGEAFYYQPLYFYVLALLHAVLGESVGAILVVQWLGLAGCGALVYLLGREVGGRGGGLAALLLFWLLRYAVGNATASLLLSENLAIPLLLGMALFFGRYLREPRARDLVLGGLCLGAAVLTRSTPLLALPPIGLGVLIVNRRHGLDWLHAVRPAVALGLVVGLCVLPATLRNLVVSGQPVLVASSSGANLWEGHRPHSGINMRGIEREPLYNALRLDRQTREVLEFARQDPLGFGRSLGQQAAAAVGITGPVLGDSSVRWELVLLAALYLAALLTVPAVRCPAAWPIHAFVATHFLSMVVFFAHQYGFRLVLPMYALLVVPVGVLLASAVGRAAAKCPVTRRLAIVAPALLVLGFSLQQLREPSGIEERVYGLGGDAGEVARRARDRLQAISRAGQSAQTDSFEFVYFGGVDQRSFGVGHLPGLEYWPMKWLDVRQAAVFPPTGRRGLAIWPAWSGSAQAASLYERCAESGVRSPSEGQRYQVVPLGEPGGCVREGSPPVTFGGIARVRDVRVIGDPPSSVVLTWEVQSRPGYRVGPALFAPGQRATQPLMAYPSSSWAPGERILVELPIPGGIPIDYLSVAFWRADPDRPLEITDPAPLFGQTSLPLARR